MFGDQVRVVCFRWIVMAWVAAVVLGDRPDITMLYNGYSYTCVAGSNTYGYGLAFRRTHIEEESVVCEFKVKYIDCPTSYTILIKDVTYGRNSRWRCRSPGYDQTTGCSAENAFDIVRSGCEGKSGCSLSASNSVFGDPCPGVLKFLHVEYWCILSPEIKYLDASGKAIDTEGNCDFENSSGCWKNWHFAGISLQSSQLHPLSPVTDERWNNFQVHHTNGRIETKYEKYHIEKKNFYFGLSVRTSENAQILLCSFGDYYSSPCYWIIIDGYAGSTNNNYITGIRKCAKGLPRNVYAEEFDCKIFKDNITVSETLLDKNELKWTHFMLSREGGNRIRFWQWDVNTGARLLLDYTDEEPLTLTYMIPRSYKSFRDYSEWKVHNYQYVNLHYRKGLIRLGPALKFRHSSSICISLYVAMCPHCRMDVILEAEDNTVTIQSSIQGNSAGPFMTWRNVRLQGADSASTKTSLYYQLYVTLNITNGDEDNSFWAIDDFHKCSVNEIRMAKDTSLNLFSCHSLKYPSWKFNSSQEVENHDNYDLPISKDGQYIGQHSNISCLSIIPNSGCIGSKICSPTEEGNKLGACTCAPGNIWRSDSCTRKCSTNYYGYNCKNNCGKCKNVACDITTGKCPQGCKDGYLPPYCQTTFPRLVSPPIFVKEFFTGVVVKLNDTKMESPEDIVQSVQLECQKTQGQWFNCSGPLKPISGQEVSITGLEKETAYLVRGIVYTNTGYAYRHENIPTTSITTTCKVDRDIYVTENSRNASISFEIIADNCFLKKYSIELLQDGKQVKPPQVAWQGIILLDLTPHTNYTIQLTNIQFPNYKKNMDFKTKEDAPGAIKDLHVLETTDSEIVLSWKEPDEKNGVIQKYILIYELKNRMECNKRHITHNGSMIVFPTDIHRMSISGLHPYSTYFITVTAETSYRGKSVELQCNTTMINDISEEEFPESISTSDLSAISVTVQWIVNCSKLRGPLYFQIVFKCVQDEWCNQIPDIVLENVNSLNGECTTQELTPFTHYSIELRAKRSQSGDLATFSRTTTAYTAAGNPPVIRNYEHYSKNDTSISLRWLNPYPPHGHLEKYTIKYHYNALVNTIKTIDIATNQLSPCDLWNEHFSCYVLSNLHTGYWYTITITAHNNGTNLKSPETSLTVQSREDKSSVPLYFTQEWKSNKINLYWHHPNFTNGRLKKFLITLNRNESELKNQEDESRSSYEYPISEETKTYTYQIKKAYQHSSSYIITVCGVNSYYGENATILIDTPPETPELSGDINVNDQVNVEPIITVIIPGVKKETKSSVSFLYVVMSKINSASIKPNNDDRNELKEKILKYSNYKHAWIAKEVIGINENKFKVFLGTDETSESQQLNEKIVNYKLERNTAYEITLVLINKYKNEYSTRIYQQNIWTASDTRPELYALLLLLLLPICIYILYRYLKKRKEIMNSKWNESDAPVKNIYLEMVENKSENRSSDKEKSESKEEHIYETIQKPKAL